MKRIIKTFIHNEENGVYVLNISDEVQSSTLRTIMNMLLQEEERQQQPNTTQQPPPINQPPPTGGLESVVE